MVRNQVVHRDLGVLVHKLLKYNMQAIRKATGMLTFIMRGFEYRNITAIVESLDDTHL